jgi:MFS family permease
MHARQHEYQRGYRPLRSRSVTGTNHPNAAQFKTGTTCVFKNFRWDSMSAVFGVLNTLIGIGMIIGTQLLTRFARHIPQQNLVVYGLGGMGVAVLTTAALGTIGPTAAGMLRLGLSASAIFIMATTLIQHETPHELLGRVMSCLMSLVAGSQVISIVVAGPVAEKIGIPNLYYGSAAMLVGIGVVGYFIPSHSPAGSVFWKRRPNETTGSRRKPADGHRNPSPRTRASAMACWQAPE